MGYYLQAFICTKADSCILTARFDQAIAISLEQGIDLIPMTEELFDQINTFTVSPGIDKFDYLTEYIEQEILTIMGDKKIAYVEAEYWGGEGGQIAIIWNNKKRERLLDYEQERINQVLKYFGVVAKDGMDEFATLGFGRNRHTREWIIRQ